MNYQKLAREQKYSRLVSYKESHNMSSFNRNVSCLEHSNKYNYNKIKNKKVLRHNIYATYKQLELMKKLSILVDGKRYTQKEASELIHNAINNKPRKSDEDWK